MDALNQIKTVINMLEGTGEFYPAFYLPREALCIVPKLTPLILKENSGAASQLKSRKWVRM